MVMLDDMATYEQQLNDQGGKEESKANNNYGSLPQVSDYFGELDRELG